MEVLADHLKHDRAKRQIGRYAQLGFLEAAGLLAMALGLKATELEPIIYDFRAPMVLTA